MWGLLAAVILRLGTKEQAAAAMEHADELMRDFLASYHDDGCCLEGSLYWAYGFGYFCYYAALVRDYTRGEIDWFRDEKIRQDRRIPPEGLFERYLCDPVCRCAA